MLTAVAATIFILIPGTWASRESWWQPGGDFFTALATEAKKCGHAVVPFAWSCAMKHTERVTAADRLIELILSYPSTTRVVIVAHSHGGNVALMAIKRMGKAGHKKRVAALYTLGTPVYKPPIVIDLNVLGNFYNLISFADLVQSVGGCFDRDQASHPRVANLCIALNGIQPSHSDLHNTLVGKWLVHLDEQLHNLKQESFALFEYEEPGIIHFTHDKPPTYALYPQWDRRLQQQRDINDRLWNAITRNALQQKNVYAHE